MPHRTFPCNECPWRLDVPPGQFPPERFEQLRATSVQPDPRTDPDAYQAAAIGQQDKFGCHKGAPGSGEDLACAGWLAVAGTQNLSVRIAVITGGLPADVLTPGADWPPLYGSYDAMAAAQDTGETPAPPTP
ncbi:DUF6283 family protein [Actinacidiphila glaucinigra]|uniref:DUF6283 family protein n=1 Tax=Actinacidiphila glaucinigra TaxID=235986 RepID=UPI0036AEB59D